MNAPTPRPPSDDLVTRVSILEEKVDLQHHELVFLRQHIDNSLTQLELRLRDEIHVSVHAAEQNLTKLVMETQKRQDEHFRWLFGMLVFVLLSNIAAIVTFANLLANR